MKFRCAVVMAVLAVTVAAAAAVPASAAAPVYDADGRLIPPSDYRDWIFLSSGLDMSYRARGGDDMHMFDNVFVKPEAYRAFQDTGTWPDQTVLVMEVRGARSKGSINKRGQFQTTEGMGMELHVKDTARFAGGWAFFAGDGNGPAAQIPFQAECYSCHREHGAVDTTFVQFYPTLLPLAEKKGTLSAAYLKDKDGAEAAK
jgi:hypothetical protein